MTAHQQDSNQTDRLVMIKGRSPFFDWRQDIPKKREEYKRAIEDTFPGEFENEEGKKVRAAMLVLLCAAHWVTTDYVYLTRLTALPRRLVKEIQGNYLNNEIFRGTKAGRHIVMTELSEDNEYAMIGLLLDAMVGAGLLNKIHDETRVKYGQS